MKFSIVLLRSAFAVAALSTSILTVQNAIVFTENAWSYEEERIAGAYAVGALASTLFFLSGATWKFEK